MCLYMRGGQEADLETHQHQCQGHEEIFIIEKNNDRRS